MPLIGQHQTATPFAGPVAGTTNRATDVLANDNALATAANAHDADATIHVQSSLLGSRPAAGTAGRLWFTTDDRQWWFDTGSAWVALRAIDGPLIIGADPGGTDLLRVAGNGRFQSDGSGAGLPITLTLVQNTVESWSLGMDAADATLRLKQSGTNRLTISAAGVVGAPGGLTVGTTTLLTTSVNLTNGAAAQVATLTNGPVAGNPTKWVPINDNGTTRYLPVW